MGPGQTLHPSTITIGSSGQVVYLMREALNPFTANPNLMSVKRGEFGVMRVRSHGQNVYRTRDVCVGYCRAGGGGEWCTTETISILARLF